MSRTEWILLILNFIWMFYRITASYVGCFFLDVSITQKIDNEGFHREIGWLLESTSPTKQEWMQSGCKLALRLQISRGMYVYPDELAEMNRTRKFSFYIDGKVNVEVPDHEATEHTLYIFMENDEFERVSITLPVHLRYQRAQITGGFGKVAFHKPSLLAYCPKSLNYICGKGLKVEAPCDYSGQRECIWRNITYQALFDDAELYIPVGDLDDYPLVSIVTLLLACAGCIYILSVLSTMPL